ncbi:MAG: phosphodiester glycosidase family protein [Deltaproteobacteria bacterium]|nr:phosphodiester glycosidase family protein [Deltaproteobacteria bacterium]
MSTHRNAADHSLPEEKPLPQGRRFDALLKWLSLHARTACRGVVLLVCSALFLAGSSSVFSLPFIPSWKSMEPGFEIGSFAIGRQKGIEKHVVIARFDPELFDFVAVSAMFPGKKMQTLRDWVQSENLVAAINAGMFRENGLTHTGLFRFGELVNNSHVAERFGAFFVALPHGEGKLPRAAVLDRTADDWQEILPRYAVAVQNFRLIGADGTSPWRGRGEEHPVSAVGMDLKGRILFIHCREAVSVSFLAESLIALPLDLKQTMYVEGGSEASLAVREGEKMYVWSGRGKGDLLPNGFLLPNIIGVRRRSQEKVPVQVNAEPGQK